MVLEIRNFKKTYGDTVALKSLNLELSPGIYGLLGPNGAGKSTLMKSICMLLEATEGKILFDGVDIWTQRRAFLKILGYMPQHLCLYPEFSVLEYLYYIGALKGMKKKIICESAEKLLESVRLSEVKNQRIKTLSGGMQQRLMFAQALLNNPKVLILDEPTAGLDPKKRIEMRNLIANYAKDKIILVATHVVSDVELIASKILILNKGNLLTQDTAQGLTEKLNGRVYEMELKESLEELGNRYHVSSIYNRKGKTYVKIIIGEREQSPQTGRLIYPDLEDVYLCYFGEEDK